jgi:steroid 5-alpha reductase family enzyme
VPLPLALAFAAIAAAFLVALWAVQRRTQDAATADVGWTVLVAAGAIVAALIADGDGWRRALVAALAATSSVRLGAYLLRDRVLSGRGEDGRYKALREKWGAKAQRNFLLLYLAQGVVAFLFVVPLAAAMRGYALDLWAAAGVLVWVVAIVGETTADRQLAAFRADPANKGAVCRSGLWGWSRHPNYFFEWLQWWAYVLIGQFALLTFVGPVMMFLFLWFITGIPYTEKQALRGRGDAYREYQRTTSAFIPLPPRAP